MFKDKDGNEYQILQALYDAIQLDRVSFGEKLTSQSSGSIESVLSMLVESQQQQINHLMRAVGNLESRIMAVQQAAGIDEVPYPSVDIHHEETEE